MTAYDITVTKWTKDRVQHGELEAGEVDIIPPGTKIATVDLSHAAVSKMPEVKFGSWLATGKVVDDAGTLRAGNLLHNDTRFSPGIPLGTIAIEAGLPLDVIASQVGQLLLTQRATMDPQ